MSRLSVRFPAVVLTLSLLACSGSQEDAPRRSHPHATTAHATPSPPPSEVPPLPPSILPSAPRVVAIGDVHGDLDAFESALRAAGAIDADAHWSGGALVVVQTGDLLDRGDQERAILDLVARLEGEAASAGGRLVALNGNHELMNGEGDFRYVTAGGYADFAALASQADATYADIPRRVRGRVVAFHPGGPYARVLAAHPTVLVVGDTLFVHGGALARFVADAHALDAINTSARAFFLGEAPLPDALHAEDGPVWYRGFALADDAETCARLDDALAATHTHRMVIGHTVQDAGITSACDAHVWRIDVGLARVYGGPIEVLEITEAGPRVITGTR